MLRVQQALTDNPQRSNTINRRKPTCTLCGKEGHKANNRLFHPEGNPNAKVGPSRAAKKNAVHQPPRNTGELLDDEQQPHNDDQNGSEEEGNISDTESDNGFGEHTTLIW